MEPRASRVLWTELLTTIGRIAALYSKTDARIDELKNLCTQVATAAQARGDQKTLSTVKEIERILSEMAAKNETFRPFFEDDDSALLESPSEVLASALDTAKRAESNMKTAHDTLSLLREQLIKLREGSTPNT